MRGLQIRAIHERAFHGVDTDVEIDLRSNFIDSYVLFERFESFKQIVASLATT